MVDISTFTTTKILDKRSSPCGVEYRCELEPLWLPADMVRSCPELREGTCTSSSSRHVKEWEHKRGSIHRCKYVEQVTSSRRSAPTEAFADLVTQHGESSSFPFHVQRLNPPRPLLAPPKRFWMKGQPGMAKKRKVSSLDTPASDLATVSPIALTAPRRSQRDCRPR